MNIEDLTNLSDINVCSGKGRSRNNGVERGKGSKRRLQEEIPADKYVTKFNGGSVMTRERQGIRIEDEEVARLNAVSIPLE